MKYNISVICGDGIGPECMASAVRILEKTGERFSHSFDFEYLDAGGIAIDKYGKPLPEETLRKAKCADSVLLGAVGGPKWEGIPGIRPEQALLGLRKGLNLYANLRPAFLFESLKDASPLKPEKLPNGLDIMIVRELCGGIYFGESGTGEDFAYDTEKYSVFEIERILKTGEKIAKSRGAKKLTVVDKANVLESSRLWRKVAKETVKDPELEFLYVDNAAMQLIMNPTSFNTIVTSNMFGDILSDEASQLTGSIGMLPSASLGDGNFGMYEPVHGSAPDIAGMNKANPIASILSAAMMLQYSFELFEESRSIFDAVEKTLEDGFATADIMTEGKTLCTTDEMTEKIREYI
ncbi:MAG: 3-isopropylmalate dehydrogenase [Clostridia bacterium]|nr:3-isopropylmalate dehydrogenase [Clostridia bacterium]